MSLPLVKAAIDLQWDYCCRFKQGRMKLPCSLVARSSQHSRAVANDELHQCPKSHRCADSFRAFFVPLHKEEWSKIQPLDTIAIFASAIKFSDEFVASFSKFYGRDGRTMLAYVHTYSLLQLGEYQLVCHGQARRVCPCPSCAQSCHRVDNAPFGDEVLVFGQSDTAICMSEGAVCMSERRRCMSVTPICNSETPFCTSETRLCTSDNLVRKPEAPVCVED